LENAQLNFRTQKLVALVAVVLFVIKIIAWVLTGSVAVLTDALESTVNVVAGFISLYSLYVAAKPRDADHPYGHGKAEFISAAVEGSLIFVAGIIIIYEALNQFIHPHEIKELDKGIYLVAFTALVNYATGWYCVRRGKKNNSLALVASGKHLQSDTYSTIGIIIGLILILVTGIQWLDGAVAIFFAFYIMYTGYTIVRSSLEGIMDKADLELLQKMVDLLNQNRHKDWIDLHNLRIIKYGSILHMDCHLTVPWYLNVHQAHNAVDALSKLVKDEFGDSVELFVHTDGCLDYSCRICTIDQCSVRKLPFEQKLDWTIENISSDLKHSIRK
jgi:cation diffusion facilitator family transporter